MGKDSIYEFVLDHSVFVTLIECMNTELGSLTALWEKPFSNVGPEASNQD
jgi:hypothetical protein